MITTNVVKERTADAATSAVSEQTDHFPPREDDMSTQSHSTENNAARQSLVESLANCRHLQGHVDATDRARIATLLPDLDPEASASALHFAVQSLLMDNRLLNTEVQAAIREMQYNASRESWEFCDLFDAALPPIRWIVPNLIPEGLTMIGGRPKVGKSLLMMALAGAVGSGGGFLGNTVDQGAVLILALEDSPRRFRSRAMAQKWERDVNVQIYFDWPDLGFEGFDQLARLMEHQAIDLVVVDTLSRAMYFDQKSMADSSDILGNLQRLALDHHASIMLVDHLRKSNGNLDTADVVEELIGSTGKTATADAILGLFRERRSARSRLAITGRDLGERELLLELDPETLGWQLVGEADTVPRTDTEKDVLEALADLGGISTTTTLAKHLDLDTGQVSRVLASLVEKRLIIRGEREGRSVPYQLVDAHQASKT